MGAAAPVIAGISMVTGLAGSVMQGMAASQTANYQAQVAANNARIAQQNANVALEQGTVQEETQREKTGSEIGYIRAQQAASGVQSNSGSALDVRSSAAEMGELNAETLRYNAQLNARNSILQAQSDQAQSQLYSSQAGWDTVNSILGGASSVSSKWLNWQMYSGGSGSGNGSDLFQTPADIYLNNH